MEIVICVGSSCHLKGSHDVVMKLQELIAKYNLTNVVELKASFCMGRCANDGVSMTINNEFVNGCNVDSIEGIFIDKVLNKLG